MSRRIKAGISFFSVLLACAILVTVVSSCLAVAFAFTMERNLMVIAVVVSIAVASLFALSIPLNLAVIFSLVNVGKVAKAGTELGTTNVEVIAQALSWRIGPTERLVKKCIRKKYL